MWYKVELHLNYYDSRTSQYIEWCDENVDKNRIKWRWDWYDVGQRRQHAFVFKEEVDLLAFKLKFGL